MNVLLAGLLVAVLGGCATVTEPGSETTNYRKSLYQGRSTVTFGTQLPIGSAEEGERRGDQALRDGDPDRALFEYVRSLEMNSKDPQVLYKIGRIHVERGNSAAAETALRWTLALDADHADAHQALGLVLLKQRLYEEATQHLTRAVQLSESSWRASNALGIIADLDGEHDTAAGYYKAALVIQPNSPMLLNNLGYSRYLAGDWDGAVEAFGHALGNDAAFERAWRNLGLVYARRSQYQQALAAFERAMDKAAASNNLGYICMNDGKYELAERYFRQAIAVSPRYYVAAHHNLAKTRSLVGRNVETR